MDTNGALLSRAKHRQPITAATASKVSQPPFMIVYVRTGMAKAVPAPIAVQLENALIDIRAAAPGRDRESEHANALVKLGRVLLLYEDVLLDALRELADGMRSVLSSNALAVGRYELRRGERPTNQYTRMWRSAATNIEFRAICDRVNAWETLSTFDAIQGSMPCAYRDYAPVHTRSMDALSLAIAIVRGGAPFVTFGNSSR